MNLADEAKREKARQVARNMRYKRPICNGLTMEDLRTNLSDISNECGEIDGLLWDDDTKVDGADFIAFMDDPKIKGFGDWMFANGFSTAEVAARCESEWLEDSDPGQEYGTTWACRKCMHSIHEPFIWNPYDSKFRYCPHYGAVMKR